MKSALISRKNHVSLGFRKMGYNSLPVRTPGERKSVAESVRNQSFLDSLILSHDKDMLVRDQSKKSCAFGLRGQVLEKGGRCLTQIQTRQHFAR